MIVDKILEAKAAGIKQHPVHSNRASNLGHPCTRYLVYERTRWQERTMHDARVQMIFDIGNDFEDRIMKDLKEAGFTVIEQQRPFFWKEYTISGHVDAKILVDGEALPLECKSMSPFAFDKTNTVEDMLKSKYAYMRQYPGQLTLYLLMDNKERGIFLLKNKSTGAMKEIVYDLDYDLGESLLKKAEEINAHVANETVPEPIEWEDHICSECAYLHICTPDRIGKEITTIDDVELQGMIDRWYALKPTAKEYDELDKEIKDAVREKDKLLVGNYLITGKFQKRGDKEFWVTKIAKV